MSSRSLYVFEHLEMLYNAQLYDDVKLLSSMLLSMCETNPESLLLHHKYQILVYQSDVHFFNHEYKKAESIYRKALQLKKAMNKLKGKIQQSDVQSDVDLKYKLHQCYANLKQYRDSISILESIPSKQRPSKVNLALAQLYQQSGMDRSAISNYKEVLRECPLSLEAAKGLLSLGVKGAEVASLVMNTLPTMSNTEWLSSWIRGQAHTSLKEYQNAIYTFKTLDSKPFLRDNANVLGALGEAQFLNGEYTQATATLQRAHALDPFRMQNMDTLAYLLSQEKRFKELETLASSLMAISENEPEPWIAMGRYCLSNKKGASTRAIYFGQKASLLDSRNIEALLLKGTALCELKKTQDAIVHFREALRLAPHRYEAHKGLVDCYLSCRGTRNAISAAGVAYQQLGQTPRSLTLYASVLAKVPHSLEKAKSFLEKAIRIDPSYLEPVYILADIFNKQQSYDKGIDMLRKQLQQQSTCKLHLLLADFLMHKNENLEALDQYSIALSLDPSSLRAKEGMEKVEKLGDLGVDSTYDVDVEDMDGTDNDGDLDGSDIDGGAWSDIELS